VIGSGDAVEATSREDDARFGHIDRVHLERRIAQIDRLFRIPVEAEQVNALPIREPLSVHPERDLLGNLVVLLLLGVGLFGERFERNPGGVQDGVVIHPHEELGPVRQERDLLRLAAVRSDPEDGRLPLFLDTLRQEGEGGTLVAPDECGVLAAARQLPRLHRVQVDHVNAANRPSGEASIEERKR